MLILLPPSETKPNDLSGLLRVLRRAKLPIEHGERTNELDLVLTDIDG